jgi:tetratricopeptide (TPR) repeat protein
MKQVILFFCGCLFMGVLLAQEPNIIVKDSAKVGNIITGEGNEINITQNITQNILPKSAEYAHLQADSVRLKKILDEKNRELENAAANPALQEYIRKERTERAQEYQIVLKQLTDFKEDVRRLAESFSKITVNSERLRTAELLFNEGKISEADAVLKTAVMEKETDALLLEDERLRQQTVENDSLLEVKSWEWLIKAQITAVRYDLTAWFDSTDYYFRRSIQCYAGAENQFTYALFLQNHNQFDYAIIYYQLAAEKYKIVDDLTNWLGTQNNIGLLYNAKNDYVRAEAAYIEALKIYRRLANANPQTYEPYVAGTQNNLGNLYHDKNDYERSEAAYVEALEIYRRLANANLQTYEPYVATTQSNLGVLYSDKNDYVRAEAACIEALKIRRRLAKANPQTYEPDVAGTQNNLGLLYSVKNDYVRSEAACIEALEIYRRLAKANPQTYEPYVATTQNNLGLLYSAKNDYVRAEAAYIEALEIRRRLANANPQTYEPDVATTQNNLGNLYRAKNDYVRAEAALLEALEIRRRLANANPQTYEPYVAGTQNNLGVLYSAKNDYVRAEAACIEALDTYRRLAKANPQIYEPYVAGTQNTLGLLYADMGRYDEAIRSLEEAIPIKESFYNQQPAVFKTDLAFSHNNLGLALLKIGKLEEAKLHLERSQLLKSDNSWVYKSWACYYAILKDNSATMENLEKAAELGYDQPAWIENEPSFDGIREEEKYLNALRRINENAH